MIETKHVLYEDEKTVPIIYIDATGMNYIRRMDTPVVSKYILRIKNMEKINKYFTVISITDFYDYIFLLTIFIGG